MNRLGQIPALPDGRQHWIRVFETVAQLRLALHAWLRVYNERWLIERHGQRSPAQVRRNLLASSVAA